MIWEAGAVPAVEAVAAQSYNPRVHTEVRMSNGSIRVLCGIALAAGSGMIAVQATGQIRRQGPADAKIPIQVSLKVGGEAFESSAAGKCTYAPKASIYNVVSELRSVELSAGGRSTHLTWWHPLDGSADMMNLSVTSGSGSHEVSTVKGGQMNGSGTVKFEKSGNGGTFTIGAKTARNVAIAGTIKCDSFAPHIAEGG